MKKINLLLFYIIISISIFSQTEFGRVSYYADKFHGRRTASGEIFNMNLMTAAHRTLPFGTKVKVTNLDNQKTVILKINDRGPFVKERIIDVSKAAAIKLDLLKNGTANAKVEIITTNNDVVIDNDIENKTNSKSNEEELNYELQVDKQINLFEIEAKRLKLYGYGVQIGSFKNIENLLNEVEEVKNLYNVDCKVITVRYENMLLHKLIIGQFSTKEFALF